MTGEMLPCQEKQEKSHLYFRHKIENIRLLTINISLLAMWRNEKDSELPTTTIPMLLLLILNRSLKINVHTTFDRERRNFIKQKEIRDIE
jgi:hypothetical protein